MYLVPDNADRSAEHKATLCLRFLTRICQGHQIRSLKTIRLSGCLAKKLLARDPSIKLIYLVRDPRAMLVSRADLAQQWNQLNYSKYMGWISNALCKVIRQDINHYAELSSQYHVLLLRYEDMAKATDLTVDKIYTFLNTTVPHSVRAWIADNTHALADDGIMGTKRNSSAMVDKWRTLLPSATNDMVLKQCTDVLEYLGYQL